MKKASSCVSESQPKANSQWQDKGYMPGGTPGNRWRVVIW